MEQPLKIAICEDTTEDAEKLLAILKNCRIPTSCRVFQSGEALLEIYAPMEYDLLLMDIYMKGMTGLETVARIRQIDENVPVAFVTSSTDHTLESYRLSALMYIEKPFQEKEIAGILKLAWMERDNAPMLVFQRMGREEKIPFSQILYLEQQTHRLYIYLKNGETVDIYEKLASLLPQLELQNFFQPHKSFSVNLGCVRSIDSELRCFVMQDGKNVPIRRESLARARRALEEHLFSTARGQINEK